jgi:hypothetical protein
LILKRPPQPLNENIVMDSATAIQTDVYIMILQRACKCIASELSPLIGIEDFRCPNAVYGLFNGSIFCPEPSALSFEPMSC